MDPVEHAERYWGVLNRLRRQAVAGRQVRYVTPADDVPPVWARVVLGALLLFGLVWTAYVPLVGLRGEGIVEVRPGAQVERSRALNLLVTATLTAPGVVIAAISLAAGRSILRALRGLRAFEMRASDRRQWTRALDALATGWTGAVTSSGREAGAAFLVTHHPGSAPVMLLDAQAGAAEARLTCVGTLGATPVLVQIVDFSSPGPFVRPPALVVLVASPMELHTLGASSGKTPFRAPPPPVDLAATEAHAALAADGLTIGWTSSGAWGIHTGPAEALFEVTTLDRIAHDLLSLCRSAPTPDRVPMAPIDSSPDPARACGTVVDDFLAALRDRDLLGVLRESHATRFALEGREPTVETLGRAVDGASPAVRTWKVAAVRTLAIARTSSTWESPPDLTAPAVQRADAVNVNVAVTLASGEARNASVHLGRNGDGAWSVHGYAVDGRQILGVEFTESSV